MFESIALVFAIVIFAVALVAGACWVGHRMHLADNRRRIAEADKRQAEFLEWQAGLSPEQLAAWWSAGLKVDVMTSANYCAKHDTIHHRYCH